MPPDLSAAALFFATGGLDFAAAVAFLLEAEPAVVFFATDFVFATLLATGFVDVFFAGAFGACADVFFLATAFFAIVFATAFSAGDFLDVCAVSADLPVSALRALAADLAGTCFLVATITALSSHALSKSSRVL